MAGDRVKVHYREFLGQSYMEGTAGAQRVRDDRAATILGLHTYHEKFDLIADGKVLRNIKHLQWIVYGDRERQEVIKWLRWAAEILERKDDAPREPDEEAEQVSLSGLLKDD